VVGLGGYPSVMRLSATKETKTTKVADSQNGNDIYRIVTIIDVKSLNRIVERGIRSGRWIKVW